MKSITSQLCILNPRPSPPFSPPLQPLCRANNQFVFNHRSFHRRHVVLFANIIIIRCQTFRLALTPIIFLLALHCKEYISAFLAQRFFFFCIPAKTKSGVCGVFYTTWAQFSARFAFAFIDEQRQRVHPSLYGEYTHIN